MSWDNLIDNVGYYVEVASNRMARRALTAEVKSLSKLGDNDSIGEWLPFLSEKSLTKSLKRDITTILAKRLSEKAQKPEKATSKQDNKVYPNETETE